MFVVVVLLLGFCGSCPIEEPYILLSRLLTFMYFLILLGIIPLFNYFEEYLTKRIDNPWV